MRELLLIVYFGVTLLVGLVSIVFVPHRSWFVNHLGVQRLVLALLDSWFVLAYSLLVLSGYLYGSEIPWWCGYPIGLFPLGAVTATLILGNIGTSMARGLIVMGVMFISWSRFTDELLVQLGLLLMFALLSGAVIWRDREILISRRHGSC